MLSRMKFELDELVTEILDQLPNNVWTSPTTTFFDPAFGGGQFIKEIETRLRRFGHSDDNIKGRVWGCETSRLNVKYAVNKYNLVGNYVASDFFTKDFQDMKFDVIVGNPPYQGKAETHQKFFNKAVEMVKDDGIVTFIQPATPYFNKKENIRENAKKMIENVKAYQSKVKIVSSNVFENAEIFTTLAITTLVKTPNTTDKILMYTSESGITHSNVDVKSVNMIEMDLQIYDSLVKKVFNVIQQNGTLQDLITTDASDKKLYIQKVRGHIGAPDFYTFLSKDPSYWKLDTTTDYGLAVKNTNELSCMVSYLKTFVARFCLSIYKFNGNNHMGELRSVPIVPFNVEWDDAQLCSYFKITKKEYAEILRCIPKYYA